ncbi:hypothetical protein BOX15_Mlig025748g6, partial [Macrostomum lignano]
VFCDSHMTSAKQFGESIPVSRDWYSVLGVSSQADQSSIRAAWKTACLKYHPDKNPDAEEFHLINMAYSVLRDANLRRVYDAALMLSRREQDHPVQEELTVTELLDNQMEEDCTAACLDAAHGTLLSSFQCFWDCRCGDRVGIHAAQLLSRLPLLQCQTCSLCLRILYDESEPRTRDLLARLAAEAEPIQQEAD